jgi:hypothetical protein
MRNPTGMAQEMAKMLKNKPSDEKIDLVLSSLMCSIEYRIAENQPPSCTLHLLMCKLCFHISALQLSVREIRRAIHADPFNQEVKKTLEWLKAEIPKFLLSPEAKCLTIEDLDKLQTEYAEADLVDDTFYEALSSSYALLGDYERSQSYAIKAQMKTVLREVA